MATYGQRRNLITFFGNTLINKVSVLKYLFWFYCIIQLLFQCYHGNYTLGNNVISVNNKIISCRPLIKFSIFPSSALGARSILRNNGQQKHCRLTKSITSSILIILKQVLQEYKNNLLSNHFKNTYSMYYRDITKPFSSRAEKSLLSL